MKIYDFGFKDAAGKETSLKPFEGKAILVVNVASKCGFTGQYAGLEKLYEQYKDQGLMIVGFPCNQFGAQEPGTDSEIQSFCQLNYGVTFPVYGKIDVNGSEAHPLYPRYRRREVELHEVLGRQRRIRVEALRASDQARGSGPGAREGSEVKVVPVIRRRSPYETRA